MRTELSTDKCKGSARKRFAPLLFLVLAGALLLFMLLPLHNCLTLSDARTQRTLAYLPVKAGEEFSLRYTHSVNLSDVTDGMEWTGKTLMLRSSLFKAYGVGMPVLADGIGTEFTNTPDGFLITGIDRPEERILLLLQQTPNNRLLYRGQEINLLDRFGAGTLLKMEVRPVSLLARLLSRE